MALSIPEDHPVRKLFQRFRQQRDPQPPDESYTEQNCVQIEPQHRRSIEPNSYVPADKGNVPCPGGGSATVPGSQVSIHTEARSQATTRPCVEIPGSLCPRPSGEEAVSLRGGARGWAKFKSATSAPPEPKLDQLAPTNNNQDSEGSGEMGGVDGGPTAGDRGDETSALHKTDSCDSGITKSDLRIDRAGDSRSSFERSPIERSPMEASLKHTFVQPMSEQTQLQTTLHEAKIELKGDIQRLSGRMCVLESQVSEILRLLSNKRRLSLPPTSSPRPRAKTQDSVTTSRPGTPKKDNGPS